mgnify:CR=1 FL=1
MTITHYYSPARALLSGTGARHHHNLGGTFGRCSGSSLGVGCVMGSLGVVKHQYLRHPQKSFFSISRYASDGNGTVIMLPVLARFLTCVRLFFFVRGTTGSTNVIDSPGRSVNAGAGLGVRFI